MDKELEEAQKLTKDDLLAKLAAGRPANLARPRRPRDPNSLAAQIVREATAESPWLINLSPDVTTVITGSRLEPNWVEVGRPSVKIS
jgi:hypothetical protein